LGILIFGMIVVLENNTFLELLAHCNLFKVGIARSGAYNSTLTQFGFQNEESTFWQTKENVLHFFWEQGRWLDTYLEHKAF